MTTKVITNPWKYEKELKELGESLSIPIQRDRVFEMTYHSKSSSLIDSIQYKPCMVKVKNYTKDNIVGILPIVHEQMQYTLSMDLSDYIPSFDEGKITWSNRDNGDPLLLSPKKLSNLVWDVKAIDKYFPIGTEEWIPWMVDSRPRKIQLTKWNNVWLVDSEKDQMNLLLSKKSLEQNYIMTIPQKNWKKIKGTWTSIKDIAVIDDVSLLEGTNTFNKDWIYTNVMMNPSVPFMYWAIPDKSIPFSILLWRVYFSAKKCSKKLLPIYNDSLNIFMLHTLHEECIEEFKKNYYSIAPRDFSIKMNPESHESGYRIMLPNNQIALLSTNSKEKITNTSATYIEPKNQWSQLDKFFSWIGL